MIRREKKLHLARMISITWLLLNISGFLPPPINAQEKDSKLVAQNLTNSQTLPSTGVRTRIDILNQGTIKPKEATFFEAWNLEFGLHGNPILPMGGLADFLGVGMGGSMFASLDFPWLKNSRMGFSAGFGTLQSTVPYFSATVTLIPMMLYYETYYIFSSDIRPYIRIGGGLTLAQYQGKSLADTGTTSILSADVTLDFGFGIGYRPTFLPRVEFLLYVNYFTAFEQAAGSFVMVSLGTNILF